MREITFVLVLMLVFWVERYRQALATMVKKSDLSSKLAVLMVLLQADALDNQLITLNTTYECKRQLLMEIMCSTVHFLGQCVGQGESRWK